MVKTFVRLKSRLLLNTFRQGWVHGLGMVLSFVVMVPLGFVGFLVFSGARLRPDFGPLVLSGLFNLFFFGWAVGPLFLFGSDDTLDPGRLHHMPLRRIEKITGLTAASAIGPGPLATAIALAGVVIGFAPAGVGALIVVAAIVVEFLLCLTVSRALTTALAGILRSRRGRDVALVAGMLVLAALVFLPQILTIALRGTSFQELFAGAGPLAWTPPGWAAQAIIASARGELIEGSLWLVASGAFCGLLIAWWARSLDRMGESAEQAHTPRSTSTTGLFRGLLDPLPRTPVGAIVALQTRYLWRDPRRRVQVLMPTMFVALGPMFVAVVSEGLHEGFVLMSCVAGWMTALQGMNQFGLDGPPVWLESVSTVDARSQLLGRNIPLAAVGMAVSLVLSGALAFFTGGWAFVPVSLALTASLIGIAMAVGNGVSIKTAYAMPQKPKNIFAMNKVSGRGYIGSLVALFLIATVSVPLGIGVALGFITNSAVIWAALTVLAPIYGYVLWRSGSKIAATWLTEEQPELLSKLTEGTT